MSTSATDKINFKEFIAKNKEKIYRLAKENTVYNSKGQATISKDDPYFNEHQWDEFLYKNN